MRTSRQEAALCSGQRTGPQGCAPRCAVPESRISLCEIVPARQTFVPHPSRSAPLLLLLLVLTTSAGCAAFSRDAETGMVGTPAPKGINGVRDRLRDAFSFGRREQSPLEMGRRFSPEERREVELCRTTFESGNYEEAIKLCRKATKKFRESSLGEEAQYYLAESWFALGRYSKAQDGYDQLFEDYPSTRYVEPATRRLYSIALAWLEVAEPGGQGTIRQVSGESGEGKDSTVTQVTDTGEKPSDPTLRVRVLPNFHDRSRPIFDTQGRALECLKSIWMNDPTGPLADDALMLTATYYQRHSNFVEADRYYEILRDEYPDSRHLEAAFVLGAHVKQMSYQGAYYEGEDLQGARRLKEQSLQLFPVSHQNSQIRQDLDEIYLQEAERLWAMVDYYRRKNRPRAIAIACVRLISEYPDTGYAREARNLLNTIDRSELTDLPELPELLEQLPQSPGAEPEAPGRQGPPVKAVSSPDVSGRATL